MISFNGVSEQLYIPEEQIKDIYNASKGKSKKEQAQIVKANVEHYRKELDKRTIHLHRKDIKQKSYRKILVRKHER